MLLLGAGESGKSTIFKQMKIINKDGYSEAERKSFTGIVYSNTVSSLNTLMEAFEKLELDVPADVQVRTLPLTRVSVPTPSQILLLIRAAPPPPVESSVSRAPPLYFAGRLGQFPGGD